jgi:hypothetical protein
MSSYLTFYLVPKGEDKKPLALMAYSRNSDIYQAYYENAHPAFYGNGDEPNYTELTKDLSHYVVNELREDLSKCEKSHEAKVKALQALPRLEGEALEEYLQETTSTVDYINDLKDTLKFADFIDDIVSDLEYSDFEKVLINID